MARGNLVNHQTTSLPPSDHYQQWHLRRIQIKRELDWLNNEETHQIKLAPTEQNPLYGSLLGAQLMWLGGK